VGKAKWHLGSYFDGIDKRMGEIRGSELKGGLRLSGRERRCQGNRISEKYGRMGAERKLGTTQ